MPIADVTITAPIGPGKTATALLLSDSKAVNFLVDRNVIEIVKENGEKTYFDYNAVATVTYTISGTTATVTIST